MYEHAYWIALLPALAFPINLAKKFREPVPGIIGILLILVSWLWSMALLFRTFTHPEAIPAGSMEWVPGLMLSAHIDHLTTMMLVVVTTVSLLVQVYSLGYMHGDPKFNRFYAFLGLFSAAMLGLVLADNFLLLMISWELVGVSSYLLIGFWYEKPSAMRAAKKAFVVTRLGDMGLLIGVIILYSVFGTFRFEEIFARLPEATPFIVGSAAMLLFLGAIGKSAQFPLHVWLPDAMEGPTPVSALIHAATMVAAGVYLTGRAFPLFEYGSLHTFSWFGLGVTPLGFVRFIGVCTLFIAATIAVAQNDIKRVLAYSTVSQLGYMILGIGTGAWVAGLFHLMTHAFFKALLFLGSGSVIHGSGTQDMREMGGLRKTMPITFWTYVVGYLALAGFPLFAGFFSKDAILDGAFFLGETGIPLYFWFAVGGAFLTAFYMTRQMVMVFGGTGTRNPSLHVHESPWTMWLPLAILAVPSFVIGWVGLPANNVFKGYLAPETAAHASLPRMVAQAEPHSPTVPDHGEVVPAPSEHSGEPGPVAGEGAHGETAASILPAYLAGQDLNAPGVDPALRVIYGEQHHGPGLFGTGLNPFVTAMGTLMGILGIVLGWLMYGAARRRSESVAVEYAKSQGLAGGHGHHAHDEHNHGAVADVDPSGFWFEPLQRPLGPVYTFLANKWYFDEFYWKTLVEPTMGLSRLAAWVDKWIVDMIVNGVGQIGLWLSIAGRWIDAKVVDGIVNGLAGLSNIAGRTLRYAQTGRVQSYAAVIFLGALFLVAMGLWLPR